MGLMGLRIARVQKLRGLKRPFGPPKEKGNIMDRRLRVLSGPHRGCSFDLKELGVKHLGRSREHNDMCLPDPLISRVHCQIEVAERKVVITDLESDAGTFVNGARVTRQQLQHGDAIRIGDTQLCFQVIGKPASESTRRAPQAPAREALPIERMVELGGTVYAHFEVGQILGQGHTGLVFRARDLRAGRSVALKLLHPAFPKDHGEMDRFAAAFKGILPLQHDNLVRVWGAGRSGSYCWIAQELVEGASLGSVIERSRKPAQGWEEGLRATLQLGRALDYLHRRQMLHRNVTPANILVHSGENFVLGDHALVRALEGSRLRQLTLRSKVGGELPFLAPEQTQAPARLDARSDLYGIGAAVYALMAGRPPFAGATQGETVRKIRQEEPTKPRHFQPSIPVHFERALLRLLAKKPEDRFQTAAELLAELEPVAAEVA
jgi:hypothetical protein